MAFKSNQIKWLSNQIKHWLSAAPSSTIQSQIKLQTETNNIKQVAQASSIKSSLFKPLKPSKAIQLQANHPSQLKAAQIINQPCQQINLCLSKTSTTARLRDACCFQVKLVSPFAPFCIVFLNRSWRWKLEWLAFRFMVAYWYDWFYWDVECGMWYGSKVGIRKGKVQHVHRVQCVQLVSESVKSDLPGA